MGKNQCDAFVMGSSECDAFVMGMGQCDAIVMGSSEYDAFAQSMPPRQLLTCCGMGWRDHSHSLSCAGMP